MAFNEIKLHGTEDFPLELYCIDKNHPKYEMAHHWHTNLELMRILKGNSTVQLNDRKYEVTKGDVLFINSEVVHSALPQNCEYECIVFDPHFVATNSEFGEFIGHIVNHDMFVKEYSQDKKIKKNINELFDAMKEGKNKFIIAGILYTLFGEIINRNYFDEKLYTENENAKNIYKLKKVLNYIRTSYSKQITLKDMAQVAGVSPKYFCSFFKTMTAKTPVEYLTGYRIEKAAAKLLSTDESVTDIAYSCGFNDLSYFIKVFKDLKGISPKQFRKDKS